MISKRFINLLNFKKWSHFFRNLEGLLTGSRNCAFEFSLRRKRVKSSWLKKDLNFFEAANSLFRKEKRLDAVASGAGNQAWPLATNRSA